MAEDILKTIEKPSVSQPEIIGSPETNKEQATETKAEQAIETAAEPQIPVTTQTRPIGTPYKTPQERQAAQIEAILSDDLSDAYLKLSPEKQRAFKIEGEKTVKIINDLLSQTKVKIKKIVELIRIWLKMLPGINRFFLEKEAKIKAEKIINLKN